MVRRRLRECVQLLPFFSCVPFAGPSPHATTGVQVRAAAHDAPPDSMRREIEQLLGLTGTDVLRYTDGKRCQHRALRMARRDGHAYVSALMLAGDTRAGSWLRALLKTSEPAESYGRRLLSPQKSPPPA